MVSPEVEAQEEWNYGNFMAGDSYTFNEWKDDRGTNPRGTFYESGG